MKLNSVEILLSEIILVQDMPLRERRSHYKLLTGFERDRIIEVKKSGFSFHGNVERHGRISVMAMERNVRQLMWVVAVDGYYSLRFKFEWVLCGVDTYIGARLEGSRTVASHCI
ncbi:hypothetical protein TNCV_5038171 [Trichonephila clavipes]|nr:hypothetical protein TNCV_5038171 [Trichonephila clavipes]